MPTGNSPGALGQPQYLPEPTSGIFMRLPKLRSLQIILRPDVDEYRFKDNGIPMASTHLVALLGHLRLHDLTQLSVFLADLVDSRKMSDCHYSLQHALRAVRLKGLDSLHLGYDIHVFSLPEVDLSAINASPPS